MFVNFIVGTGNYFKVYSCAFHFHSTKKNDVSKMKDDKL